MNKRMIGVLLVLICMAAPAMATDWQQFQYDVANTGSSTADAPDDNTTKWITPDIGAVVGSQAMIEDGKVFVYADTKVYALNKETGGILWTASIPGDTKGWGSWASPAYSNSALFVSGGYNLTKINAATGVPIQEIAFPDGGYSCNGGPTVADGMVFAGSGGSNYYAFDESDLSTVVWTYPLILGTAVSTPSVADDKVVFGGMSWGGSSNLYCVNKSENASAPGTTDEQWTTLLTGGIGGSASIDAANNRVYVATFTDYGGDAGLLYALDFTTGAVIWNQPITYSDSTPAISGELIYVSGSVNAIGVTYCFNQAGVQQWTVPCGYWTVSPTIADGKLFTGRSGSWSPSDGTGVYNATTGAPVWSYAQGGSSPSIANPKGMVVTVGNGGKVYAFGTPASQTPYVISGNVSKADSTPCNNPTVLITNTATGEDWNAETRSDSNYYRLVISSDNVSAGNILQFDVSGCAQANTTQYTATQADIDDGGLFGFNITLGPTITSRNDAGDETNEFYAGENVSVTGTGLAPNTWYTIWIQDDPVGEGDLLVGAEDPSDGQENVLTDGAGSFGPELIWSNIQPGSLKNYDIVVDNQDGTYNAASDGIDSATGVGIAAPVPELASIALFAVGLVMLLGWLRLGKRD